MRRRCYALVGLILLTLSAGGCSDAPSETVRVQTGFDLQERPAVNSYTLGERTITFARSGNPTGPLVLFVHGSPGDWRAFEHYLSDPGLQRRAQLVSVDRPGFGGSGFGDPEPSLERQAALLRPLLDYFGGGRPAILVGHSLGGSVIARMAMDFSAQVGALVLVAPALDPEQEELRWYNRLASLAPVRLLLPKSLDISNLEILPLRAELTKMLPFWKVVTADVIVIQGAKDRLVSPENADFAKRVLRNASVTVERIADIGHFIPWERPELIRNALVQLLNRPELARNPSAGASQPGS